MKKLLLITLIFIIGSSLIIGCNTKINHDSLESTKQSHKNVNNKNLSTNANTTYKNISNTENLELIRIDIVSSDDNWCKYSFKSLGLYSNNKIKFKSKDTPISGFILGIDPLKNSNIENFTYNELIAPFGHIKYPSFLKLEKSIVPASGAGFRFKSSNGRIEFEFGCHEPFPNVEGTGNQTVYDLYKIMTDPTIDTKSKVTYKAKGKNWVCVSSEKNNIISYDFVKLSKDLTRSFYYSYPKKYEKVFDTIIQESYKSFNSKNIIR